jgi:hypothetical protein
MGERKEGHQEKEAILQVVNEINLFQKKDNVI